MKLVCDINDCVENIVFNFEVTWGGIGGGNWKNVPTQYVCYSKTVDYENTNYHFSSTPQTNDDVSMWHKNIQYADELIMGLISLEFSNAVWLYYYHIKLSFAKFVNYHPVGWS